MTVAFGSGEKIPRLAPLPLRRPLGRWIKRPHIQFQHYWDAHSLYRRRADNFFDIHQPYRISKRIYSYTTTTGSLPPLASPTLATLRRWGITVPAGPRGIRSTESEGWNEETYLAKCTAQEARILYTLPPRDVNERTVQGLRCGQMVAAKDGSYDPHRRSAACSWVLFSRRDETMVSGGCPVDGDFETLDSYRAELEGIRSLAYYLRFLRRTNKTFFQPIQLTIWIDNEQALRHVTNRGQDDSHPDRLLNESDILADIQKVSKEAKIEWNGQHVKSHQEGDPQKMPLEVRLNEECDRLAKQCLRETSHPSLNSAQRPPHDRATLRVEGQILTNNLRSRLQYAAMALDMRDRKSTRLNSSHP